VSSLPLLRARVDAQLEQGRTQNLRSLIGSVLGTVFSFETAYILYIFSGLYKSDPALAWIPGDLTAILFGFTIVCGSLILLRRGLRLNRNAVVIMWLFLALVAWVWCSMLWSPSVAYAQRKGMYFPTLTLWAIFAATFIIAREEVRLRRFFIVLTAFTLWVTLVAFFALRSSILSGNVRGLIRALGSHYGTLGVFVGNCALLLLLHMIYYVRKVWQKVLLTGATIGIMGLLLFMGSRTSLVFPVIASLVPLSLNLRPPRTPLSVLRVIAVILVVGALIFASWNRLMELVPGGPATLRRFATLERRGLESEGRVRNLEDAANVLDDATYAQLFCGHGIGSWPLLVGDADVQRYPHNLTLEVAVELGLIGLLLFYGLIAYALHNLGPPRSIRRDPLRVFLLTMFVSMFIIAHVSGDLHENRALFMMLGLMSFDWRRRG
jgi:hypothetical protein